MAEKAGALLRKVAGDGATRGGNGGTAHELGRERVVEIQRARILAAMVEECGERGAGNVTVAHVVERAGVSRRTFYELFADREDCFLAAFDEGIARASRCVSDSYDPDARWAERIRTAVATLLSFLDAEPAAGRLLIVGSLGAGANALERRRRVLAQMILVVDEGRREARAGSDLPPLTAEGVVGGAISVLHSRLLDKQNGELVELTGSLMGMIVLPYLGPAAARRELARSLPRKLPTARHRGANPLSRLEMRLTYRTVRVLMAIAAHPGSSNRVVADAAEVTDQGQMSKLLARLQQIDLIENTGGGASRGEPNAWTLTDRGWQVQGAIAE
ncbi:MAG TPA: TetR/AcrR family transcriptional regulator [Solirubrobacteraceae bacterium]|nr:TetR/AcrR family transcriptional regulator [Solirubrobacteraceae bacterium]